MSLNVGGIGGTNKRKVTFSFHKMAEVAPILLPDRYARDPDLKLWEAENSAGLEIAPSGDHRWI